MHIGPWKKDGNPPVNPVLASTIIPLDTCTTITSTALTWTPGSDDCSLEGYYILIDSIADSDPATLGVLEPLPETLALGTGNTYIHVIARDTAGQFASEPLHIGPWKKDDNPPVNPVLASTIIPLDTCTTITSTALTWTPGSDDCGLEGYYILIDSIADSDPATLGVLEPLPETLALGTGNTYIHVIARDAAGQFASEPLHIGPWKEDGNPPVNPVLASTIIPLDTCTTITSTALTWTPGSDDCSLEGYYILIDSIADSDPATLGVLEPLPETLTLGTGNTYIHVIARDAAGQFASEPLHIGPWKKDDNPPVNPVLASTIIPLDTCTTITSTALTWTPGSDDCSLEGYYILIDSIADSDPATLGVLEPLPETLALGTGNTYIHVIARDTAGQFASEPLHIGPWKKDDNPPVNPVLASTIIPLDTCTTITSTALTWTPGSDDCGLEGYYILIDSIADSDPATLGVLEPLPETLTLGTGNTYIHVIARDAAGQFASEPLHIGPWKKDGNPPVNPVLASTIIPLDTCTTITSTALTWTPGSDDCSDVSYAWVVDENPTTNPLDGIPLTGSEPPANIHFNETNTYLHLITLDEAGNTADIVKHYGPWTQCDSITGPELLSWNLEPFSFSFDLNDPTDIVISSIQVLLDIQGGSQTDITSDLNLSYSDTTSVTVTYSPVLPFGAGSVITATIFAEDTLGNATYPDPYVVVDTVRDAITHEVYEGDSIQDALDGATAGDTVHVNAGVHTLSGSPLNISPEHSGITLLGDGYESSFIQCDYVSIVINGASGFTIKGFSIGTLQDISLLYIQGLSSNVLIDGNFFAIDHSERTPLLWVGASGTGNRIANNVMTSAYNAGTGVYVDGSMTAPEIVNNTMTDLINGIDCVNSAAPVIAYNIIAFNSEGMYADNYVNVHFNCVYGNGNNYDSTIIHNTDINEDPLFENTSNKDFHLNLLSPCMDSLEPVVAMDTGAEFPETDLDGALRPQGTYYDMGCYESRFYDEMDPWLESWSYDASQPAGPISFRIGDDIGVDTSTIVLSLASNLTAERQVITHTLQIDEEDPTNVLCTYTPNMPWPANAVVTATATFQDMGGNTGTESISYTIRNNTSIHVYEGDSIQEALDTATAGDNILVHSGAFSLPEGLYIESRHSGIRLSGEGPDYTTLNITGSIGWGIHLNGVSDFTLDGFNIPSGNLTQGHILLQYDSSGVLIAKNRFSIDSDNNLRPLSISATGADNRIVNNLFVDNFTAGIAVDVWTTNEQQLDDLLVTPVIVNNTFAGFRTGIYSADTEPAIAYNVIANGMWGIGRASSSPSLDVYYNTVYGNTQANYSGPIAHGTDLNTDPMFVNAGADDYHLADSSQSVDSISPDAAALTGIALPVTDLDNASRPLGGFYDPGCYETLAALAFTTTPGDQVDENSIYTYAPVVTGSIVSFGFDDASQQPDSMTISETTGEIHYNPLYDDEAGTYTVIIKAIAADGRTVTQSFTVTVTALNDPPGVPASVEPQPYAAMINRLFSLEFYSFDEETTVLEYSLQSGPANMNIPVPTDGIVEWVPQSGTSNSVQFSVSAWDGTQSTSTDALSITVVPTLELAPFQGSPAILVTNTGAAAPVTTTVEIACQISGGQAPYNVGVLNGNVAEISNLDADAGTFTLTPLAAGRTQLRITDTLGFTQTSGLFDVHYIEATLLAGGTHVNAGDSAILTINEPDSGLEGMSFTIPQGSTSTVITPTVSEIDSGQPFMDERTSPVVEIGPEGTTFAIPASLAFPNNSSIATDELLVFTYDPELGRWVYVPDAVIAGNTVTVPLAHLSLYTLAKPSLLSTQLVGGTTVEDYRIVSFPAYAADMDSIVNILSDPGNLNSYDDAKWRLFGFDPLAQWSGDPEEYYVEGSDAGFDEKFPFGPCQAYWIISRYANQVEARGLHVDSTQDYYTTLQPGWNLLGNPFTSGLYWTMVESSRDGETFYRQNSLSESNPLKNRNLFYYEPETRKADSDGYVETSVMQPYVGYWIKNGTGAPLVLKLPVSAFVQSVVGSKEETGELGLFARVTRKISGMIDQIAMAGTDEDRPPSPPGYGGSNAGTDSNSIGVAEGDGGGGCFVDTVRTQSPHGLGLPILIMSLLGLAIHKKHRLIKGI